MKSNYQWDFPLKKHEEENEVRKEFAMNRLKNVRTHRNEDKTYQRNAKKAEKKIMSETTSLGFFAKDLIGLDPTKLEKNDGERERHHTNPKAYETNKQGMTT